MLVEKLMEKVRKMKSYSQDWVLFIIVKPRKNQLNHYQWCIFLLNYGPLSENQEVLNLVPTSIRMAGESNAAVSLNLGEI